MKEAVGELRKLVHAAQKTAAKGFGGRKGENVIGPKTASSDKGRM